MRVLYTGYYREKSQWGSEATNNILALKSAGVDVVCRPIVFKNDREIPLEVRECEQKPLDDIDVHIQHVFPEHLTYSDNFKKNITILRNEYVSVGHSPWIEHLGMMDEVWVPSHRAASSLPSDLLNIRVIPKCFDVERYKSGVRPLNIPDASDKFKFYTIIDGGATNIATFIKCFHSEFDTCEDAACVVQINGGQELIQAVDSAITSAKQSLGIHKDPTLFDKDILIPNPESHDSAPVHQWGDCYVCTSAERSLTDKLFDAMAFGSTPIHAEDSDLSEYGSEHSVKSVYAIPDCTDSNWGGTYNGRNLQLRACEAEMRQRMRALYEEWKNNPMCDIEKKKKGLTKALDFDLQVIGKQMKEAINA